MIFDEPKNELMHYGTPRHSGRYPWGSGDDPEQHSRSFVGAIAKMKAQGFSEKEIAKGMGILDRHGEGSINGLRSQNTIAKNEIKRADIYKAQKLKATQMSNTAIAIEMFGTASKESTVRSLLEESTSSKNQAIDNTAGLLKSKLTDTSYLDIGLGNAQRMGVSNLNLKVAINKLEEEGYKVHYYKVDQLGTGKQTLIPVLAPPGVEYKDILADPTRIKVMNAHSEDNGRSFTTTRPPKALSSKRVMVRFGDEGGSDMDGVIQLRRGVDDVSLGSGKYAQVRIQVDKTHYLKGMAMYADNMPDGIDVIFNTNKKAADLQEAVNSGKAKNTKLAAMKPLKTDKATGEVDTENPFGAVIKPGGQRGVLNIVNEEGDWGKWSKNLSSQMLSKQPAGLAKTQLDLKFKSKLDEFDEIQKLTNPAVKKTLLDKFADDADSSSVHLKAAALPKQGTHAILPLNSLKETEVYAPNYVNGTRVVLIRYPHGGKFEIPELVVNNKNVEGNSLLKQAKDAIGINSKVAERLSGADFDGDTVLVIPNNNGKVKSAPALAGLKGFDPMMYKNPPGAKAISADDKQHKMGDVSNLITDMTIKGANFNEIAKAVKHSMVVIDAEKHNLNVKQSYLDNDIPTLKKRWQSDPTKDNNKLGASTLISRASSDLRVLERKERPAGEGGAIDPATGKKMYVNTDVSYVKNGKTVFKKTRSTKMAEADDAFDLSSGTVIEGIYANHANKLKALANEARKASYDTPNLVYSKSARTAYSDEVKLLDSKLNLAIRNKPLERNAQILANSLVAAKRFSNPNMDAADLKKIKGLALNEARVRVGARKEKIEITPNEWKAIQAGAISHNKLIQILNNTDPKLIKTYATPRMNTSMSSAKKNHALALLANGYTQAEVADAIGVSLSMLKTSLE